MLIQISLLETGICLLDPLHEQGCVGLLSLMNEIISDMILEQLERKRGSIEAEEGRSASYLSVEDVHIIHHVLFGITLHKSHCATSGEGWFCIFHDILSGDQDPTGLSSS